MVTPATAPPAAARCTCAGRCAPIPLTATQRALWLSERTNPGTVANVVVQAVRVQGDLDFARLANALQATVDRHPALRTTFAEESGVPVQLVHDRCQVAWQVVGVIPTPTEAKPYSVK